MSPLDPAPPSATSGFILVTAFTPWLVDLVLILRLLAIYPLNTTSLRKIARVFSIPVLLKLGRLAALIVFIVQWKNTVDDASDGDIGAVQKQGFTRSPAIKVEWLAQMADNGYVSYQLLWLYANFGVMFG